MSCRCTSIRGCARSRRGPRPFASYPSAYILHSIKRNGWTKISTSDRTHARTGPDTPQTQTQDHTPNSNTCSSSVFLFPRAASTPGHVTTYSTAYYHTYRHLVEPLRPLHRTARPHHMHMHMHMYMCMYMCMYTCACTLCSQRAREGWRRYTSTTERTTYSSGVMQ